MTELFINGDVTALDRYWSDNYVQHNPQIPNGRDALKNDWTEKYVKFLRDRDERKTISEIAHDLGFENMSYFSRLLKKETGMLPTDFKNQFFS